MTPTIEFMHGQISQALAEHPNQDAFAPELLTILAEFATGEAEETDTLADLEDLYARVVAAP